MFNMENNKEISNSEIKKNADALGEGEPACLEPAEGESFEETTEGATEGTTEGAEKTPEEALNEVFKPSEAKDVSEQGTLEQVMDALELTDEEKEAFQNIAEQKLNTRYDVYGTPGTENCSYSTCTYTHTSYSCCYTK